MSGLLRTFGQPAPKTIQENVLGKLSYDPNVKHRASMLPLVRTQDDKVEFGYPQMLINMIEAAMLPGHVLQGGSYTPEDVTNMALDVGMMAAPVGYASAPRGAIAMGAGGKKLPMDQASRINRAKKMGFNTDKPLYHGTPNSFNEFKIGGKNTQKKHGSFLGEGVYLTDNAKKASSYAKSGDSPNVIKTYIKDDIKIYEGFDNLTESQKNIYLNTEGSTNEILKKLGFGGKKMGDTYVIFDPKNIRSVHAKFDPKKADSADLLAVNPVTGVLGGLLKNTSNTENQNRREK